MISTAFLLDELEFTNPSKRIDLTESFRKRRILYEQV